ncbi:lipase/acyltransferase domain-containing protein [Streptomyces europaeiscabiei]|uniref:PGAP1-like alpha/beta domain-containing protein n=1 Tax=Streptomyces europaeiscabiei TaxID=146819 RepID=UPI002E17364F
MTDPSSPEHGSSPLGPLPAGPHPPADARRTFREWTALLGSFSAGDLLPRGVEDDELDPALQDFLLEECERVTTPDGRRWSLTSRVRAQTLEKLGTPERLLDILEIAPRAGRDTARDWTARLLSHANPPLEAQSFEELYAALTVVGWFQDAPGAREALARGTTPLPGLDEIQHGIKRARLLQPLRALADATFTGRTRELAVLNRLTEVPPQDAERSDGAGEAVLATDDVVFPWLIMHGPGGVGKSTLVARFVLDRTDRPTAAPEGRTPCVYLSFDRHDLVPDRPLTLIAEAVRQLGLLFPELARRAEELEQGLRATLTADRLTRTERGPHSGRYAQQHDEQALVAAFSALVTAATGGASHPFLLTLDAFEQVQRRGPLAVRRVLNFLHTLQRAHPDLRVLAAGRAPVDDPRFRRLPLEGFDPATARAFLRRQLAAGDATRRDDEADPAAGGTANGIAFAAGTPDPEADAIIGIVGSNPLNLKLAAALVRREGTDVLHDPQLRRHLHLRLGDETVQGVLYRRILDHMHDPDLRRIASPGLVVRKLTPDVIREVLAVPCGLGRVDEERARRLFHRFRDEATLVEEVPGQDTVVHRGDVRRVMLPLLRRGHAGIVDRIHRKAVRYYALLYTQRPSTENRAEELYHRLSLAQATHTLDERWTDEAGALLEDAMVELPPRSQVYLTERLGNTVDADLRARADDETWTRQALRTGTALLAGDSPAEALALLDERPDQVKGHLVLMSLRVRSLAALGRSEEAYELVDRALDLAAEATEPAAFTELALTGARICEDLGHFGDARDLLTQARRAVPDDDIQVLSVAAAQLRLHRRAGALDTTEAQALRADTLARVRNLSRKRYTRHPSLIRELAAEIGDEMPELVSYTARSLGVDLAGGSGELLRASLTDEDVADFEATSDEEHEDESGTETRTWLTEHTSVIRGNAISDFLDSRPARAEGWNTALVTTYQHEVDRAQSARGLAVDSTSDAVVLLPGFGGSTLVDIETGKLVWGVQGIGDVMRFWRQSATRALAVTEDERSGRSRRLQPTALLSVGPAWLPMVGGLSPYQALSDAVGSVTEHRDAVMTFPYDWRLSVEESARRLADAARQHLIQWRHHPGRQVSGRDRAASRLVFVAHSMGGLVARAAFAIDPLLCELTRDLITIGTPFHGVPRAVEYISGRLRTPFRIIREARTMPGVYDLLPDYACVRTEDGGLRRLTLQDVRDIGGDVELAEAAMAARQKLRRTRVLPRVRAVVGVSQPTPESLAIEDGEVRLFDHAPRLHRDGAPMRDAFGEPVQWRRGGDGVVPRDSAAPEPSNASAFVSGQHGSLVSESGVVDFVRSVLTERPVDSPVLGAAPYSGEISAGPPTGGPRRPGRSTGAGIGLPAANPAGLGLSAPSEVSPGRTWTLTVTGAGDTAASVECRILDVGSGLLTARPVLRPAGRDHDLLAAEVTLPNPGFYQVVVSNALQSVTALVMAADLTTED